MRNIEEARNALRRFENKDKAGGYEVRDDGNLFSNYFTKSTRSSREMNRKVMMKIQNCIESHERGNSVYESGLDMSDSDDGGGGSRACQNSIM